MSSKEYPPMPGEVPPAYEESLSAPPYPGGYPAGSAPYPGGYPAGSAPMSTGYPPPPGFTPYAQQPVGYTNVRFTHQQPIIVQPGVPINIQWMAAPAPMAGVPIGLEYLSVIDKVKIRQKIELLEMATSIECPNKYSIENERGEQVYFAVEQFDFVQQQFLHQGRAYKFNVVDNFNRVVFTASRETAICAGCCSAGCQSQSVVQIPPNITVGTISTNPACCSTSLTISDSHSNSVFSMNGPCYCSSCCNDTDFPIVSVGGDSVGNIRRFYPGCLMASVTNADTYELTFPLALDVHMKAALIGTVIMLDFMQFEQPKNQNRR